MLISGEMKRWLQLLNYSKNKSSMSSCVTIPIKSFKCRLKIERKLRETNVIYQFQYPVEINFSCKISPSTNKSPPACVARVYTQPNSLSYIFTNNGTLKLNKLCTQSVLLCFTLFLFVIATSCQSHAEIICTHKGSPSMSL